MFEKAPNNTNDQPDVFRPAKGSSKVIIGNGVKLKGEITYADEVQIDGSADVTMSADNLIVGGTGSLKGTIQEQGFVSGSVEYQNLQIKLGGKINGDVKVSEKVVKITETPKVDSPDSLDSPSSLQDSVKEKKS